MATFSAFSKPGQSGEPQRRIHLLMALLKPYELSYMKGRKIKVNSRFIAGYVESKEDQLNVIIRPIDGEALVKPTKKRSDTYVYAFDDIEGARR